MLVETMWSAPTEPSVQEVRGGLCLLGFKVPLQNAPPACVSPAAWNSTISESLLYIKRGLLQNILQRGVIFKSVGGQEGERRAQQKEEKERVEIKVVT